ncbi:MULTISPECIES: PRC-barrel domain containing protein [Halorussus]|uniref:PRC-barrel domain containing protein n=1 Tax=Halorussus TaxID=1070314 RepID=UPI000E20F94E|nr:MULTISPECIES: PRC-barrel domain containing protein [Halorussus]NHN58861.1 PRC-barrel domain containing protein [Halorussus sp. JP-T4]
MDETLTQADEGKRVVGPEGEVLGTIDKVDQGMAHVEPDAGDYESVKRYLNWEDSKADDYTFQETAIEEVTDDEVVLREGDEH